MRVVCKTDLLPAVRVVTKNVRGENDAADGSEGRDGFDIAGAKALSFFLFSYGTTKVVPWRSLYERASCVKRLLYSREYGSGAEGML